MSYLLGFWPVKSFLTYVLSRSVGKYLKNKIDFSNYDLQQKKITIRDLELNTQMINESLKDSPFKVMHVGLGSVQINNPSLNLISSKISIELSNVEVIIMPVLNVKESQARKSSSVDSENQNQQDITSSQEVQEVQKSEEYNVLNNLFNKILSNLEVKITTISIKVLTRDVDLTENSDIPTFMLRLTNLEYKRSTIINSETRPISDWQVILDGKTLDIGELSLHLLPSYFIDAQRDRKKQGLANNNDQRVKLKHPSEYPQINHFSTILVVKPSIQQQTMFKESKFQSLNSSTIQTTGSIAAISLSMSFPSNQKANKLELNVHIPSIESLSSYDQLKTIIQFGKDLELYKQQREGRVPIPTKEQAKSDVNIADLEQISAKIKNSNITPQELEKIKEKSLKVNPKSLTPDSKKKKEKDPLKKKKKEKDMIIKFIKLTQKKSEFQKLQDDLQKSSMMNGSEDLTKTQMMMASQYQESARKQPLSIKVQFALNKVSVTFVLNYKAEQYDRIYDSIQLPQIMLYQQIIPYNTIHEDNHSLYRENQTISSSHYNFEVREFDVTFMLNRVKRSSKDPLFKVQKYYKQFEIFVDLKKMQLNRYDLSNKCNKQYLDRINQNLNSNYFQDANNQSALNQSSAQYESFDNSGMFQSANEFYKLDQSIASDSQQKLLDKSLHKRHSNNGGQAQVNRDSQHQSPNGQANVEACSYLNFQQQPIQFGNIFTLNPYHQHFCKESVISFKKLRNQEYDKVVTMHIKASEQDRIDQFQMRGKLAIGLISVNFGVQELIFLTQLLQDAGGDKVKQIRPKQDSNNLKLDSLDIYIEDIQIDLFRNIKCQADLNLIVGLLTQHSPIQELLSHSKCICNQKLMDILLRVSISNIEMKAKVKQIKVNFLQIDLQTINQNYKCAIASFQRANLSVDIDKQIDRDINNSSKDKLQRNSGYNTKTLETLQSNSTLQNHNQVFTYYENDEIEIISDEEQDEEKQSIQIQKQPQQFQQNETLQKNQQLSPNKDSKNSLYSLQPQTQTVLRISIEKAGSQLYTEDLHDHKLPALLKLEEIMKFFSIGQDLAKCWSYEKSYSTYEKVQYYKQHKVVGIQIKLKIEIMIENFELQFCSKKMGLERQQSLYGKKISKQNIEKLFKLRLNQLNLEADIGLSQQQEGYNIQCGISDLMFLDYLQHVSQYHQSILAKDIAFETNLSLMNLDLYYSPADSSFNEELERSAPFVILYKQQGIKNSKAISLQTQITFNIVKQYKDVMNSNIIATLVGKAFERQIKNTVLQVCEEINLIKRNPLNSAVSLKLGCLVFRLTSIDSELAIRLIKFSNDTENLLSTLRVKPLIEVVVDYYIQSQSQLHYNENQSITVNPLNSSPHKNNIQGSNSHQSNISDDKSEIRLSNLLQDTSKLDLIISELTVDYDPILRYNNFERVFNDDVLNYDIHKIEENANKHLRTMTRALIHVQELKAQNSKNKDKVVNKLEINNLGLNMIKQNTVSKNMNPLLLLDYKKPINCLGDVSLLDYLGFVQILSIDLVKLKYVTEKNITINLKQQKKQTKIKEESHQNYLDEIQQDLLKRQQSQQDEDLFETSYGMTTIINKNLSQNDSKIMMHSSQQQFQQQHNIGLDNNFNPFATSVQEVSAQIVGLQSDKQNDNYFKFDDQIENILQSENQKNKDKIQKQISLIDHVQEKKQKVKVFVHKIILFVAQDSYHTFKHLMHCLGLQNADMQFKLQKLQQNQDEKLRQSGRYNKVKDPKKNNRRQILAKSLFQEDEESLQKIFDEFLEVSLDKDFKEEGMVLSVISSPSQLANSSNNSESQLNQSDRSSKIQSQNEKSQISQQQIQQRQRNNSSSEDQQSFFYEQNKVDNNGYFQINSGMRPDTQDIGISKLQIQDYIQQEDRFQELTEKELNPFCYKKCHELPKKLREMFLQMKILIEVQTIDLKLYQGRDFDFETRETYSDFQNRLHSHSKQTNMDTPQDQTEDLTQSMLTQSYVDVRESNKSQTLMCNFVIDIQNDYLDHKVRAAKDNNQSQNQSSSVKGSYSGTAVRESQLSVSQRQPQQQNESKLIIKQQGKPQRREKNSQRGFFFNIQIKSIQFTHNILKDYKDLSNFRTDFTHYVFSINQLMIRENISKKGEIVRDLVQPQNQFKYDNLMELVMKFNIGEEFDVAGFKAKVQPFKLLLNQGTVLFLQKFFDLDFTPKKGGGPKETYQKTPERMISQSKLGTNKSQLTQSTTSNQKLKPLYIDQLKIQPFSITLGYTSHRLNFYDLKNGNIIELLNFFNINDLKLNIKQYDLEQRLRRDEAIKHVLKYYKDDLIENQKINFVKAIGPIRSLFNISGALYGVIQKPYQSYYNEKGLLKGFEEGFSDLYSVMTEESQNFTNKIRDGMVKVRKAAEKHL